jgi:hypothetical protein
MMFGTFEPYDSVDDLSDDGRPGVMRKGPDRSVPGQPFDTAKPKSPQNVKRARRIKKRLVSELMRLRDREAKFAS